MKALSEAQVQELIWFKTWKDQTGLEVIQANLGLCCQEALDPLLAYRDSGYRELVRTELTRGITYQLRTKEVEAELARLREIEHQHYKCPYQFGDR